MKKLDKPSKIILSICGTGLFISMLIVTSPFYNNGIDEDTMYLICFGVLPIIWSSFFFITVKGVLPIFRNFKKNIAKKKNNDEENTNVEYERINKKYIFIPSVLIISMLLASAAFSAIQAQNAINRIGKIDLNSGKRIKEAESSINLITKFFVNSDKVYEAKREYLILVENEAAKITKKIDNIGDVNKLSHNIENKIIEARNAVNSANVDVKNNIANIDHLENAEETFNSLKEKSKYNCSSCNGTGKKNCYFCNGNGNVRYYYGGSSFEAYITGHDDYTYGPCSSCDGTGKSKCESCNGNGYYYNYVE